MKNSLMTEDPQKQENMKRRSFTFRINIFFFVTFALFSVLIVRLAMLQFVEGERYKSEEAKMTNATTPIPPIRGNIFDRDGFPIAYTTSTQSLYFRMQSNQSQDDIIAMVYKLEEVFKQYGSKTQEQPTAAEIMKAMDVGYGLDKQRTHAPSYHSVPRRIKSALSQDEIAYFAEHRDEYPWLEIMEESVRTYADNGNDEFIAVQLVGYMRSFSAARADNNGIAFYQNKENTAEYLDTEDVGFDGIERAYQEVLRGKNGYKSYPVNAEHKIVGNVTITPPIKGNNLYLTIHKDVQLATEKAIMDHLDLMKSSSQRYYAMGRNAVAGYAVAMEVETGKIVAMASMPDYDPNEWIGGIASKEKYDEIQPFVNNGTITTAYPNYPGEERAKHPTSIVYLGSTIKPLSVLIGLKEGFFNLNTRYYDRGKFTYGRDNSTLSNSDGKAWGNIDPVTAIRVSSNTFMSEKIGIPFHAKYGSQSPDKWAEYLGEFGLGVSTESGLPREYTGNNEFQTAVKESFQSRMVFASWGQNEKYTTLQLAQFVATLANRGERLKPLLVDRIETYDGQLVQKFDEKVVLNKAEFDDAHWDAVLSGMQSGVQGFDGFPYSFTRKTGTSTQRLGGKDIDNAVFIAYAPSEKPKLAVAVVVPEGGFGSWGAAPIARKIFDAYDQAYGLDGIPKGKPADEADAEAEDGAAVEAGASVED